MKDFGVWLVRGNGVAAQVCSYERLVYWTDVFLDAGAVPTYEVLL